MIELDIKKTSLPKYKQIVYQLEELILSKKLRVGDKLPSLNQIKTSQSLSRDTVIMAFNELKNKGIIQSVVGKGYFVLTDEIKIAKKIFLLFDELNPFKEELYNSIIENLDNSYEVDVFFHHFNAKHFRKLIQTSNGSYHYYVIMPGNLQNTHISIQQLPKEKVFILDQINDNLKDYSSVYQDFQSDIYQGLSNCLNELKKYKQINLICSKKQPLGLKNGFIDFCAYYGFNHLILPKIGDKEIQSREVYVVFEDIDLIKIIKKARRKGWICGREFGLISYNETPLKEVIEDGITTISTNFYEMGEKLVQLITHNSTQKIKNNFKILKRKSL